MAPKLSAALLSVILAGPASSADLPSGPAPLDAEHRHELMQQLDESVHGQGEAARGQALASRFRELNPDALDPGVLCASDDATLKLRFEDAKLANFYHPDAHALQAMQAALAELERRQDATPEELLAMRNALLAARRFDDAARFSDAHPGIEIPELPRFIDAGGIGANAATVWREAADGRFERIALDLAPTQILVEAGCHFAEDAAREIASDPVLGPVFRDHASWLSMPPGPEDPAGLAEWNRAHPDAPLLALYDRDEWPMFPRWRMPTFHVVRDGKVLGSVLGWKPEGARDELVAMLRANGLLPEAP